MESGHQLSLCDSGHALLFKSVHLTESSVLQGLWIFKMILYEALGTGDSGLIAWFPIFGRYLSVEKQLSFQRG